MRKKSVDSDLPWLLVAAVAIGEHGLASLLGLSIVVPRAVRAYRYLSTRAVRPGVQDPASMVKWLWICTLFVGVVAIVVANVAAFGHPDGNLVLAAIVLDVVAVFALPWVVGYAWAGIEARRRDAGYVIAEICYPDAPMQTKSSMRRIHKSARTVRKGRAYQDGMFGELNLDELVFETAEHAVASSELAAAVHELRSTQSAEDLDALRAATKRLDEICCHIEEVEASLKRTSGSAKRLSDSITRPEEERAEQRRASIAAAARDERRQRARAQLDEAAARAAVQPATDSADIEDRVTAVGAGYQEAAQASNAVLMGPTATNEAHGEKPAGDQPDERGRAARKAVWKATKLSASSARKLSAAAGKAGKDRIRNRYKKD